MMHLEGASFCVKDDTLTIMEHVPHEHQRKPERAVPAESAEAEEIQMAAEEVAALVRDRLAYKKTDAENVWEDELKNVDHEIVETMDRYGLPEDKRDAILSLARKKWEAAIRPH